MLILDIHDLTITVFSKLDIDYEFTLLCNVPALNNFFSLFFFKKIKKN